MPAAEGALEERVLSLPAVSDIIGDDDVFHGLPCGRLVFGACL